MMCRSDKRLLRKPESTDIHGTLFKPILHLEGRDFRVKQAVVEWGKITAL